MSREVTITWEHFKLVWDLCMSTNGGVEPALRDIAAGLEISLGWAKALRDRFEADGLLRVARGPGGRALSRGMRIIEGGRG